MLVVFLAFALAACGDDSDPTVQTDSGPPPGSDGAAPDAGPTMRGDPIMLTLASCDAMAASVYETPEGLPAFSASVRGSVIGCAELETLTVAEIGPRLASVPDTVAASAVRKYLIAYRTERDPGEGGISTAVVYLPDSPIADHVPLIVAAHGTVGLGDQCAPSHDLEDPYWDAFELSWAAYGLPVIAPDYAGLGTEGVHAYFDWADSARSTLDAARALKNILPEDRLDGGTIVYGHSQGGGVALSAAAYASLAPDVDLRAVVAFAPGYDPIGLIDVLSLPTLPLTPFLRATAATIVYADFYNLTDDPARAGDLFAPSVRDYIVEQTSTLCFDELIDTLDMPAAGYTPPATAGDAIDPDFSRAALACAGDPAMCDGIVGEWVMRDRENDPHLSPDGPPVLVIASSGDTAVTPGALGCVLDRLEDDGVTPDVCIHEGETHSGIVTKTAAYAIDWALAAAGGTTRPQCTGTGARRMCSLF